jgi:hypothetical protein
VPFPSTFHVFRKLLTRTLPHVTTGAPSPEPRILVQEISRLCIAYSSFPASLPYTSDAT